MGLRRTRMVLKSGRCSGTSLQHCWIQRTTKSAQSRRDTSGRYGLPSLYGVSLTRATTSEHHHHHHHHHHEHAEKTSVLVRWGARKCILRLSLRANNNSHLLMHRDYTRSTFTYRSGRIKDLRKERAGRNRGSWGRKTEVIHWVQGSPTPP